MSFFYLLKETENFDMKFLSQIVIIIFTGQSVI